MIQHALHKVKYPADEKRLLVVHGCGRNTVAVMAPPQGQPHISVLSRYLTSKYALFLFLVNRLCLNDDYKNMF